MKISKVLQDLHAALRNFPKDRTGDAGTDQNLLTIKTLIDSVCLKLETEQLTRDGTLTEESAEKCRKIIKGIATVAQSIPLDGDIDKLRKLNGNINKLGTLIEDFHAIKTLCEESALEEDLARRSIGKTPSIPTDSVQPVGKEAEADSVDWLTEDTVAKVRQRLLELAKNKDTKDLGNVAKLLDRTYSDYKKAQGEQKIKLQTLLYNIVHMPGWGYVQDERDEYRTMTREQIAARIRDAREKIKEANLVGTEAVTRDILGAASMIYRKMAPGEDEGEGQALSVKQVGVLPVFCIDGPPGTGKTTIAEAVATSMDMGFYDLSMAGKDDANIVYGRGKQWAAPSPGLVAEAQLKSGRERVVILLDEAEKATGSVPNALGQILEKTSPAYKDDYFEANVDKRKVMFVLTTNNYDLLPPHIQSRVRRIYFYGYDDETKVKILKNMAVNAIGRLQGSIKWQTSDANDLSRKFEEKPFRGFHFVKDGDDVIKYIVQHYITEPGVREAKDLLDRVVTYAGEKSDDRDGDIVIDIALVHEALGKPDPLNARIKELNQKIGITYKELSELRDRINTEYDKDEPVNADTKEKFSALLAQMEAKKQVLLDYETKIVEVLARRTDQRSRDHKKEHEASIQNIQKWTSELIAKINTRYFPEQAEKSRAEPVAPRVAASPGAVTDADKRIADIERELASIREQLSGRAQGASKEGEAEAAALRARQAALRAEVEALRREKEKPSEAHPQVVGTGGSDGPGRAQRSGDSSSPRDGSPTPVILSAGGARAGAGAKRTADSPSKSRKPTLTFDPQKGYRDVMYGFRVVERLKKEAGKKKPGLTPSAKMTLKEFDTVCKKEIDKIAKMKALSTESDLQEKLGAVNRELQEKDHTPEEAMEKVRKHFESTGIAKYAQAKTYADGRVKYDPVERFEHRLNTIAMYETLSATQTKEGDISTLTISDTTGNGTQEPIVNVSHNQKSGLVKIVAEHSEPGDKALLEMVLFAQRCSKNGKFNIQDCESNPKAAIKLYLFGRSLGLAPQLNAETLEGMAQYIKNPGDRTLTAIYKDAADHPDWGGDVVLAKLGQWEADKKDRERSDDGLKA